MQMAFQKHLGRFPNLHNSHKRTNRIFLMSFIYNYNYYFKGRYQNKETRSQICSRRSESDMLNSMHGAGRYLLVFGRFSSESIVITCLHYTVINLDSLLTKHKEKAQVNAIKTLKLSLVSYLIFICMMPNACGKLKCTRVSSVCVCVCVCVCLCVCVRERELNLLKPALCDHICF